MDRIGDTRTLTEVAAREFASADLLREQRNAGSLSYYPRHCLASLAVHQRRTSMFAQAAILMIYLSISCVCILLLHAQGRVLVENSGRG